MTPLQKGVVATKTQKTQNFTREHFCEFVLLWLFVKFFAVVSVMNSRKCRPSNDIFDIETEYPCDIS